MAVVFISHSSRDKVKVDEINRSIEEAGFDSVFLDHDEEKGIKTGEHWEQRLYSEIKRAHVMLLILSPNWIGSKWCFAEYTQAKALGKEIIPVIIDQGANNEVDDWIDSYLQKSDMTKDDTVLSRVIHRIKEISLETQGGFKWDTHRSPYPGMTAFEAEDAAIFFGREEETREAIEKLTAMKNKNAPKFLNIVAASGMGKSSFLKAGILPQLNRSYKERWFTLPVMRPSKRPLYAFANLIAIVLNKTDSYKEIYESLKDEHYQETLDDILTELGHIAPGRAILFPLDQAEELYSLASTEEKAHFFKCLDYLLTQQEQFFTLWTLRADFLKEFQGDSTLKGIYKTMELFALPPVRKENVVSIIKEPAVVAGIDIDERLIEKIKEDMQTTDALPLLALGLKELYLKHGKDKKLTLEAYKSLAPKQENPLEHIVKEIAEEAIKTFKEDKEVMNALKDAFIPHLVRVNSKGEYIKITASLEDLPRQAQVALEALVKERLLIKKSEDETQTIEIAHEALIRKWPLLQTWLQEAHEFLVGKSQLEQALQEYDKENTNNRHKTYLTGLRLQKATNWLAEYPTQLTQKEKTFIKEGREFEEKQANRRKQIYTVSFITVLLFGVFAVWQWNESQENFKIAVEERQKALTLKLSEVKLKGIAEKKLKEANYNLGIAMIEKADSVSKVGQIEKSYLYAHQGLKLIDKNINDLYYKAKAKSKLLQNIACYPLMDFTEIVRCFTLSPDGKNLAIGLGDGTVKVWDIEKQKEIITLKQHTKSVSDISFSPDGKTLATSSEDNTAILWDVKNQKKLAILKGHVRWVEVVAFSPDGKVLATGSSDNTVKLWDVKSQELLATLDGHTATISSLAFSPNGYILATSSFDRTVIFWDLKIKKEIKKEWEHTYGVNGSGFSKYVKTFYPSSHSENVKVWDVLKPKIFAKLKESGVVLSVDFSADGKTFAMGLYSGIVKLWDVLEQKELVSFRGHEDGVSVVAFSPDGKIFGTGSSDKTVKLWNVRNQRELAILKGHTNSVSAIAFSPDVKTLFTGSIDSTVKLWDMQSQKELAILNGHKGHIGAFAFSPDGKIFATGSSDKTVKVWDVLSQKEIITFLGHEDWVTSVAFSPDSKTLLSCEKSKIVRLWNLESKKEIDTIQLNTENSMLNACTFSPDGKTLAVGLWNGSLSLWNLKSQKKLAVFSAHKEELTDIAFSPDGKILATCSIDKTVKVWDVLSQKEIITFRGHKDWVQSVAFSPDGKTIASGSRDKTVKLWSLKVQKELFTLEGHEQIVNTLSFSPNGKLLITGSDDDSVILWDVQGQTKLALFPGQDWVSAVSFFPDGKTIVSGSGDNTVKLWDIRRLYMTKKELIEEKEFVEYLLQGKVEGVSFVSKEIPYIKPVWPQYNPFHWLGKAEIGDIDAMYQLGIIYDREGENKKALNWYKKSAEKGHKKAKERVGFLENWMKNNAN